MSDAASYSWAEYVASITDEDIAAENEYWAEHPYGMFPAQLEGRDADGRPFYFRCRHDHWTIEMAWSTDDATPFLTWRGTPGGRGFLVDFGDGDITRGTEVDAKITEVLGHGWTKIGEVPGERLTVTENCRICGAEFQDGGHFDGTRCPRCSRDYMDQLMGRG